MSKYSLLKTHLTFQLNNVKNANDEKNPAVRYPYLGNKDLMTGAGGLLGALGGAGLGAGLFTLFAPSDKLTLRNYLLASLPGGLLGAGAGIYGGRTLGAGFAEVNSETSKGNPTGDPGKAIEDSRKAIEKERQKDKENK